jgi:hypothetical protein
MRDTQAKRILFNELRRGPLSGVEASLYPSRLRADLVREGIARRTADGGLELANPTTYTQRAPSSAPPPPTPHESGTMPAVSAGMQTLTVRVPQAALDMLDALAEQSGQTRSEVLRDILERTGGAGLRKRAGQR